MPISLFLLYLRSLALNLENYLIPYMACAMVIYFRIVKTKGDYLAKYSTTIEKRRREEGGGGTEADSNFNLFISLVIC